MDGSKINTTRTGKGMGKAARKQIIQGKQPIAIQVKESFRTWIREETFEKHTVNPDKLNWLGPTFK